MSSTEAPELAAEAPFHSAHWGHSPQTAAPMPQEPSPQDAEPHLARSWWMLQPETEEPISGTVVMVAQGAKTPEPTLSESLDLKQTSTGVVLNPQPQDDPNDPLNWPVWRRDVALLTISVFALLAGGMTPLLAPVMTSLGKEFGKPYHSMTYLVGVLMASMGVGSAFFAPIALKYGKRLVYLGSMLIFFGGLCWGANATSYSSLMGARVLSGIGAAPAESLPSTTIAEIYFAHERAYRLGIYTLLLLGGKNLSPLVSGFIANRYGWHWIFWVAAIICGGVFVGTFLFVHETFWDRTPIPNARSRMESEAARRAREDMNQPPWDASRGARHRAASTAMETSGSADSSPAADFHTTKSRDEKRRPFFQNLAVYSGRKTQASLPSIFIRPFVLYTYVPVLYATLIYGTSVVWLSVIAETIGQIFTNEPYHFRTTSVGLLYIATFSGGLIGSVIAGKASDISVRFICRRNSGVYEPEFRLLMILPVMLAVTIGLMGFGWSTKTHDLWIVPAIFLGVLGFGTSLASTVSITYVVDCYRKFAVEALVSLNVAKNILGLAFSIFVPYFFESSGSKTSYIVYGSIEIALCLLAIPVYRYGKVMRRWYDVHGLARNFYTDPKY